MNVSKTKTREAKNNSPLQYSPSQPFLFISASLDFFFFSGDKGKYSKNEENVKEKIQKLSLHEKGNFNAGTRLFMLGHYREGTCVIFSLKQ